MTESLIDICLDESRHHYCPTCDVGLGGRLNSSLFLSYHKAIGINWSTAALQIVDDNRNVIGCMPIAIEGREPKTLAVSSHSGTVFGGLRTLDSSPEGIQNSYKSIIDFLTDEIGATQLEIRLPPELVYPESAVHAWSLWSLGMRIETSYLGRAINLHTNTTPNRLRKRSLLRARRAGVSVGQRERLSQEIYGVLWENRVSRHGVEPLHTLDDLSRIEELIPDLCRVFTATHDGHICAGGILFVDRKYVALQYLFRSRCAEGTASQDAVVAAIVDGFQGEHEWLLLGTSTEPMHQHQLVNQGLDAYKQSWRGIPYTAFRFSANLSAAN